MHQHKIAAQILLTLSIFNLVLGAVPVVRKNCDTHDDVVVPMVVRNTEVMFKERGSESDGPTLSQPSTPPSHDGSTPLHSPAPPSPDWPSSSHSPYLSDEEAPLFTLPPTGPEIVPASDSDSPPRMPKPSSHDDWYWESTGPEIVPASDSGSPPRMPKPSSHDDWYWESHDNLLTEPWAEDNQARLKKLALFRDVSIAASAIVITGGVFWKLLQSHRPPSQDD